MDEKVRKSLEVLKVAAQISEDYYSLPLMITYSGGKDSDVMLDLALKSGVDFEVSHSVTTVDAPQTNAHVNKVFKSLRERGIKTYKRMPRYKGKPVTMFSLIVQKGMPPTRIQRYCCQVLKETSEKNRVIAVGVRAAESRARKGRGDFSIRGVTKADSRHFNLSHVKEVFESAKEQDPIWDCTMVASARKNKTLLVNPIYNWTDIEVWEYIRQNSIEYNPLYDCGYSRIGCILCPLSRKSEKILDGERFPKIKERYIKAFDEMLAKRREKGKHGTTGTWVNGKAVYRWWIEDDTIPGQLKYNLDGEIEIES